MSNQPTSRPEREALHRSMMQAYARAATLDRQVLETRRAEGIEPLLDLWADAAARIASTFQRVRPVLLREGNPADHLEQVEHRIASLRAQPEDFVLASDLDAGAASWQHLVYEVSSLSGSRRDELVRVLQQLKGEVDDALQGLARKRLREPADLERQRVARELQREHREALRRYDGLREQYLAAPAPTFVIPPPAPLAFGGPGIVLPLPVVETLRSRFTPLLHRISSPDRSLVPAMTERLNRMLASLSTAGHRTLTDPRAGELRRHVAQIDSVLAHLKHDAGQRELEGGARQLGHLLARMGDVASVPEAGRHLQAFRELVEQRRPELARIASRSAIPVRAEAIPRRASRAQPAARVGGEAQLQALRTMHPGVAKLLRPPPASPLGAAVARQPERTPLARVSAPATPRAPRSSREVLSAKDEREQQPAYPRPLERAVLLARPAGAPLPQPSQTTDPKPPLPSATPREPELVPALEAPRIPAVRPPAHALARIAQLRKKLERLRRSRDERRLDAERQRSPGSKDERRIEPPLMTRLPVEPALHLIQQLPPRIPPPSTPEERPQLIDQVLQDAAAGRIFIARTARRASADRHDAQEIDSSAGDTWIGSGEGVKLFSEVFGAFLPAEEGHRGLAPPRRGESQRRRRPAPSRQPQVQQRRETDRGSGFFANLFRKAEKFADRIAAAAHGSARVLGKAMHYGQTGLHGLNVVEHAAAAVHQTAGKLEGFLRAVHLDSAASFAHDVASSAGWLDQRSKEAHGLLERDDELLGEGKKYAGEIESDADRAENVLHRIDKSAAAKSPQQIARRRRHTKTPPQPEAARAPLDEPRHLDALTLSRMEQSLEGDFGGVHVHTGAGAEDITRRYAAEAVTVSDHVFFAPGKFNPSTSEGEKLIAHELTHVLQKQRRNLDVRTAEAEAVRAERSYANVPAMETLDLRLPEPDFKFAQDEATAPADVVVAPKRPKNRVDDAAGKDEMPDGDEFLEQVSGRVYELLMQELEEAFESR